jgi:hypothetical protein
MFGRAPGQARLAREPFSEGGLRALLEALFEPDADDGVRGRGPRAAAALWPQSPRPHPPDRPPGRNAPGLQRV